MRSADMTWRSTLALVLGAALAGCASVTEPLKAAQQSIQQAITAPFSGSSGSSGSQGSANAAAAPVAAASAATAAIAPAEPEVPVNANVLRAYEDAKRALRSGRVDEAERGFRALAQSNPELGGPHANLGVILRNSNKLPESVAALEKAVKANPRQPLYWNQLGVSYRHNGQFAKAREAYERAIALDPNYAAPHLNLGILSDMYLGDGAKALELYTRYLALSPSGDTTVTKWIADLKNRKPAPITVSSKKEKE